MDQQQRLPKVGEVWVYKNDNEYTRTVVYVDDRSVAYYSNSGKILYSMPLERFLEQSKPPAKEYWLVRDKKCSPFYDLYYDHYSWMDNNQNIEVIHVKEVEKEVEEIKFCVDCQDWPD
jgi:hypothetical protein